MVGRLIEEELFTKHSIIDPDLPEGQKAHEFLASRAKALAGKYIDFDEYPVTFVISDVDEPNAFFVPVFDPEKRPRREQGYTTRFIRNPLDTAVIAVTRGLIEMVDNLDQLDFVLGHELTHMLMRQHGIRRNSKGEEGIADLHAVDLMYDAGSDPKQALSMSEKLGVYSQEERKKRARKRYKFDEEKEEGINWSQIFDVHVSDSNRKAGIQASLTRLSHLIDDREKTNIDKSVFKGHYHDPVDVFLEANNYKEKGVFDKFKVLIDAIDHLSGHMPAEEFFQAALDALPEEHDYWDWRAPEKREALQARIDAGYTDYFTGTVIDKRYQQKIANLAEGIIEELEEEHEMKDSRGREPLIDGVNLNIYLQDRAYEHIAANGYPVANDVNYLSASGVLYSYFYCLFANNSPPPSKVEEDEPLAQIEIDISATHERIRNAQTVEDFMRETDELARLDNILEEIRTILYSGQNELEVRGEKLDNLSSLEDRNVRQYKRHSYLYEPIEDGETIPWNNLVEIAKTDEIAKERIVQLLKEVGIKDFRITHDLPYVRMGYEYNYRVIDNSRISDQRIPQYELDFAVHRDTVLQAYDYIQTYFENESTLIDEACARALDVNNADFVSAETTTETFNRRTNAYAKIYDFVSLFNALPDTEQEEEDEYAEYGDPRTIVSFISERYQDEHPMPGMKRRERSGLSLRVDFEFSKHLLSPDNPVFQSHFGEDFERELMAKKDAQQQRLFDTALDILSQFIDMWVDVKPKLGALSNKDNNLREQIWRSEDDAFQAQKQKERKSLEKELTFYREKEDQTSSIIYNFLSSIFDERRPRWYRLQKLTPEQKTMLAEFAVRDEKGAVRQILIANNKYEHFCDYLGILEEQEQRVISGDYELSELMQVIADNYGYQQASTKEALRDFVDENQGGTYLRDDRKYMWYLHMFDTMRYLEKTSDIDVRTLAISLAEIRQDERSIVEEPYEIIEPRYQSYENFLKQSSLLSSVTRAISHQDNYTDLSCQELLQTADAMIGVKDNMQSVFDPEEGYDFNGNKKKSLITDEEKAFIDFLDENIGNIIRQAEERALQNENALVKIVGLYQTYNAYRQHGSHSSQRDSYLKEIEKEGRLENLAILSEEPSFWPENVLDHVKAFVFAKNTFFDNKEFEDKILNNILEKLEAEPSGNSKTECIFILLDKNVRAAYPETRERLFKVCVDDVSGKLGKDDGSEAYQARLQTHLDAFADQDAREWDIGNQHGQRNGMLSNSISAADKYLLMRQLSDAVLSQEQTSRMMKDMCQIKLDSDDMLKSYLYGIGVDYLTSEMDSDAEMARKFVTFLNSKGEQKDCEKISEYVERAIREKYHRLGEDGIASMLQKIRPVNCKVLYENFWAAPLEARAVIIARMLKSATHSEESSISHSWESVFDLVMDTLISPDDDSTEAEYAQDIMYSYIKSRSDYERELIMSAMMVANRNMGDDTGNIGKALKLFLENMGPAEIKLGQAISSHPDTSENIKTELQKLKSAADVPPRWALYEWIRTENIPEALWKEQYLGAVLGSASYYTTVALGEDKVLRILRPEAREKALKGFRVIEATVKDLEDKEDSSDLDYRKLTSAVQEMVVQAARMSDIETDHTIGQQQYEDARDVYDGVTLSSGEHVFSLKVMDWRAKGQNWIIMDCAQGPTFNAMPEETPEQLKYKREFAKAYIVFEITNILSGKKFDHDKHGAQLSIDPVTHAVGIYDTGAMALHDPSPEEQQVLGNVLYDVIKDTLSGHDTFSSFGRVIGEKIDDLRQSGANTHYLVEVKKGLLALGDFFRVLRDEDIKDILPGLNLPDSLSKDVRHGMTERMSMFKKLQYRAFMALKSSKKDGSISIKKPDMKSDFRASVTEVVTAADIRSKSSWLQETFSTSEEGVETSTNIPSPPYLISASL